MTGLGAPVSVRIRFEACEAPVVIDALRDVLSSDSHPGGEDDYRRELRRMLEKVGKSVPAEPFEVLWPSALAIGVLQGAFDHATRRTLDAVERPGQLAEVRAALDVMRASLQTLEDFLGVDNGGLQDVSL